MSERGNNRTLLGVVKSSGKMDKTVVVQVMRRVRHPLYKKFITKYKKYLAHDERNEYREGDKVVISESRPLSRLKRWRVQKLVERKPG
ncbi:30S ribosomal protein S17 [Myxococcota bacterium]|nr:30S ribosomal protein S17 [Myxococcota bacterium]MBU1382623.1 30S ribosomal protein S17 [Myxococcota bacterium]MBU1495840.1 30S ribosomal protein S17 [Myxococcota bacterium]